MCVLASFSEILFLSFPVFAEHCFVQVMEVIHKMPITKDELRTVGSWRGDIPFLHITSIDIYIIFVPFLSNLLRRPPSKHEIGRCVFADGLTFFPSLL